ncbi:MBL fold metallo-hydrolase [Candidatus Roizmanbacteria bacterium]|nr:MBL fold metallo-hydrolase [Candidatus Roizmanbacteria bacterium]
MKVFSYPLGELRANCFLLIQDNACLIVDPGDSAEFIIEQVQRLRVHPVAILATHGHFDHLIAVGELQLSLQTIGFFVPFYLHPADSFLLHRTRQTAEHFLEHAPIVLPPQDINNLVEGEMSLSPFRFKVLSTPGHTPGSVCLYFPDEKMIFTGDTVFKEGVGSYDHSYSDKRALFTSVNRINSLPEGTEVYPGHGETFFI